MTTRKADDVLKSTRREARLGRRAGEEAMGFAQAQAALRDDLLAMLPEKEDVDYFRKVRDGMDTQYHVGWAKGKNKGIDLMEQAIKAYFGQGE